MRRLVKQSAEPTMTFDGRTAQTFVITMRTSITSLRVNHAVPGMIYVFVAKQTATGGKTLTWSSNFHNAAAIDPSPLAVSVQSFIADTGGILKANLPGTWSES